MSKVSISWTERMPEEFQRLFVGGSAVVRFEGTLTFKSEDIENLGASANVGFDIDSVVIESVKGDGTDMAMGEAKQIAMRNMGTGG